MSHSHIISTPAGRRLLPPIVALLSCLGTAAVSQDPEQPKSDVIEGFTEPYADVSLAASEMGTLASVSVAEGDQVEAGQFLASLDVRVLKASLAVAEASMKSKGLLKSAMADLSVKEDEFKKMDELRRRNHASEKELVRVIADLEVARARVQSVEEELEVKRLEYQRILAQLQQREIHSPISGIVVDVRKDPGEFVSPSDPVVIQVIQLDPLLVVFPVPAEHRDKITKGQHVPVKIGMATEPAVGLVEYVSPTAEAGSGTVRVKVRIPNGNQQWHSGERSVLLLEGVSSDDARQSPQVARRTK